MRKPRRPEKVLRAVRPSAGLAAEYRRRILALVEEMANSVEHWIGAAYRRNEPAVRALAMDAPHPPQIAATYVGGARPWTATVDGEPVRTSKGAPIRFSTAETAMLAARRAAGELLPADELRAAMGDLSGYWLGRFDEASDRLGRWFSRSAVRRTDVQLQNILRDGGLSVRFTMTPAARDVLQATIGENVGLIRSIPQQYLRQVEGMVMRSVQRGGDARQLYLDLRKQYGITKRRASLIARDQNHKATSAMQHARQAEAGIDEAVWLHSHGGKEPRPTHVKMDGQRYKVSLGMFDPAEGRRVWPGELINCRCVSKPVIKGLS